MAGPRGIEDERMLSEMMAPRRSEDYLIATGKVPVPRRSGVPAQIHQAAPTPLPPMLGAVPGTPGGMTESELSAMMAPASPGPSTVPRSGELTQGQLIQFLASRGLLTDQDMELLARPPARMPEAPVSAMPGTPAPATAPPGSALDRMMRGNR